MKGRGKAKREVNTDVVLVIGAVIILAGLVYILYDSSIQAAHSEANNTVAKKPQRNETSIKPAVAGSFYPAERKELSNMIDDYLGRAQKRNVWGIRGLVSPHAGYVYSGPVAAYGYKQLIGSRYDTVIILGPSHHVYFDKVSVGDADYYETPLGKVPISPKVKDMLKEGGLFTYRSDAFAKEHSVEVEIPFLQKVLPPFDVIPIIVGDVDPRELAEQLSKYVDDDTLVIASSDLSHYKPYDECVKADNITVNAILGLDYNMMAAQGDACGKIPIMTLMELAKRRGWRTHLMGERNSGDTQGDKSSVVGYSSIAFYDGLDDAEQQSLLDLAQETLERHYQGGEVQVDESTLPAKLLEDRGCFVTLNKNKELRGCIGHLVAQEKLYRCVIDNALNAALNDGRFEPVSQDELNGIKIEVSVLTAPKPLDHSGPDDLLNKLIPGVDGIILKSGLRQSTYLPVVWEMLPDKVQFLEELCVKQGSPRDCWKTADVETYQAQEFHQDGFK